MCVEVVIRFFRKKETEKEIALQKYQATNNLLQ
jgi:hypothetical protein